VPFSIAASFYNIAILSSPSSFLFIIHSYVSAQICSSSSILFFRNFQHLSFFWEILSMISTILNGVTPLPSQQQNNSAQKECANGFFPMSAPDEDYGDGSPTIAVPSHGIIEDFHAPRFVVSQKK
jgi:hypothetical protein